ncbi:MAG TPA: hypothetical protein VHY31_19150 [Streptosporangiaceae bacterium]|jgi:3-oxoadipate enol-lactonase|nr:hypothetical protein [Streptosporangiaceae bacterium]
MPDPVALNASLEGPADAPVLVLGNSLGTDRARPVLRVSLGGMVGMWLAAPAPERITGLGLCRTSARLPPDWEQRARVPRSSVTRRRGSDVS